MRRTFPALVLLGAAACLDGCYYMRTGFALDELNKPSSPAPAGAPKVDIATRVARLTRDHLSDAYLDPKATAGWMRALAKDPKALVDLSSCLSKHAGGDVGACYETFTAQAVTTPQWGIPAAPAVVDPQRPPEGEIDAERFLANVTALGASFSTLSQVRGRAISDSDLKAGLKRGSDEAAAYLNARKWHRTLRRPTNALIMSGGAANGAFTAGAIWHLFHILESCRGQPGPKGCGDARIDMVAGTSTGSLIGVLVDVFFTPGQESAARQLLVDNYTCSVESDLYCLNSTWDWHLADDLRGLVRFDGIEKKLRAALSPAVVNNSTELVTVSVDYASGDIYALSDQDPADLLRSSSDRENMDARAKAVLASIVEPVLADPIDAIPSHGTWQKGTFIDGGVRSGLPLMQAVLRGADRALIFSNAGIEPDRVANPAHAISILMRTLDLMVAQPRVGEVQQAEIAAVARRFVEYNVCEDRLTSAPSAPDTDPAQPATTSKPNREAFCRRSGAGFESPREAGTEAAVSAWIGPARFDQVATSWRTLWMYRPEVLVESAQGYQFTPKVMRPLFLTGVSAFHKRCREMLRLLDIKGTTARAACDESFDAVEQRAKTEFKNIEQCMAKPERRTCD